MKNSREVDLLVVGQGLAGSAVAIQALARNYRILVIDQPSGNQSSAVAAGLFNPVTGRKMSRTWLADELFPHLHRYYTSVERLTGQQFFHPMPLYRAFVSIEEQNEWMGRSADAEFREFLESVKTGPSFGDLVNDPYGGLTVRQSGFLDTAKYMAAVRQHLEHGNAYVNGYFDPGRLDVKKGGVQYSHPLDGKAEMVVSAPRVVFCQGIGSRTNPWFDFVPVRPLKGEFLTVQCEWQNPVILNRGVYMVPAPQQNEWRVGATYNREDQEASVTERAKVELSTRLGEILRLPYVITGQQWGFRPTTPDRRPILGAHPQHPSLIIFNGLGTKGVSLAPYFSEVLIRWLESKGTIRKEADVSRF